MAPTPESNGYSGSGNAKLATMLRECANFVSRNEFDPIIYQTLRDLHEYAGRQQQAPPPPAAAASSPAKVTTTTTTTTAAPVNNHAKESATDNHSKRINFSLGKKFGKLGLGLQPQQTNNQQQQPPPQQKQPQQQQPQPQQTNHHQQQHQESEWCQEHFTMGCACKSRSLSNNSSTTTESSKTIAPLTNESLTRNRSSSPKVMSRPPFQRPINPSSPLIANGWIEQQRRSKMRVVWKDILASLVEGRKPGEETTLWIQREVLNPTTGKKELEALHQIPMKWLEDVQYLDYSVDQRFLVKVYNVSEEFLFRCHDEEAAQNWVMTLRSAKEISQKGAVTPPPGATAPATTAPPNAATPANSNNRTPVNSNSATSNHSSNKTNLDWDGASSRHKSPPVTTTVPFDESQQRGTTENPASSTHRMTVKELRAVAHGAGINTVGMERGELEAAVARITVGAATKAPPTGDPRQLKQDEPKQKEEEEEMRRRQREAAEATARRQREVEEAAARRQAEEIARREAEELAIRQREAEEAARRQREADEAARRQREVEEAARRQREAEEAARRRLEEEEREIHRQRLEQQLAEQQRRKLAEEERRRAAAAAAAAAAEEERRRLEEEEAERRRLAEEEELLLRRLAEERRQAEEAERRRLAEEEQRRRQAAEEEQRRRQAAEEEQRRYQAEEEFRRRQAAAAEEARRVEEVRRVEEEQRRRIAEQQAAELRRQEALRQQQQPQQQWPPQQQQWQQPHWQQPQAPQHPPWQQQQQPHPHQGAWPPPPHAQWQQPQQPYPQQQTRPPPPPQPSPYPQQQHSASQPPPQAPQSPVSLKYAQMAQQTDGDGQAAIARVKHEILLRWALQPPNMQTLRPIDVLVTSIHTVFPPAFGVAAHDHFTKWKPVTQSDIGAGVGAAADSDKLTKVIRKIRFFLHPDKLPRDLNSEQQFMCKMLWDITSDAWEEFQKRNEELDWIRK